MALLASVFLTMAASASPTGIVADPCAPSLMAEHQGVESRVYDFGGLCRYRADDRALLASGARVRVVLLGDSITETWGPAEPDFFRDGIVNRGISGQTSGQLLVRFRQDVIDLKPSAVHIMVGTNDIAGNSGPTTLDDVVGNIQTMIDLARLHHIRVILGSVLPADHFNWAPQLRPAQQIAELNRRLLELARRERIEYVDYYSAMRNGAGGLDPADAADGVHPTKQGFAKMRVLAARAFAGVR